MTDERAETPGSGQPQSPEPPPPPPPAQPYGPYPGGYHPAGYPPYPPTGQPYGAYPPPPAPRGPSNGLGIAALVVAVIALVLVWSVLGGLLFGIIAVVLGFLAHGRCKRGEADNRGVAISGIALGAVACVLSLVFVGIWLHFGQRWFNDVGGGDFVKCMEQAGNDQAAQQRCNETFQRRLEDTFGTTPAPTR